MSGKLVDEVETLYRHKNPRGQKTVIEVPLARVAEPACLCAQSHPGPCRREPGRADSPTRAASSVKTKLLTDADVFAFPQRPRQLAARSNRPCHRATAGRDSRCLMLFGLSADHSVRFPDGTTLVGRSFQSFVGNFRPQLPEGRGCRLVRVPFSVVWSPWHVQSFIQRAMGSVVTTCFSTSRMRSASTITEGRPLPCARRRE